MLRLTDETTERTRRPALLRLGIAAASLASAFFAIPAAGTNHGTSADIDNTAADINNAFDNLWTGFRLLMVVIGVFMIFKIWLTRKPDGPNVIKTDPPLKKMFGLALAIVVMWAVTSDSGVNTLAGIFVSFPEDVQAEMRSNRNVNAPAEFQAFEIAEDLLPAPLTPAGEYTFSTAVEDGIVSSCRYTRISSYRFDRKREFGQAAARVSIVGTNGIRVSFEQDERLVDLRNWLNESDEDVDMEFEAVYLTDKIYDAGDRKKWIDRCDSEVQELHYPPPATQWCSRAGRSFFEEGKTGMVTSIVPAAGAPQRLYSVGFPLIWLRGFLNDPSLPSDRSYNNRPYSKEDQSRWSLVCGKAFIAPEPAADSTAPTPTTPDAICGINFDNPPTNKEEIRRIQELLNNKDYRSGLVEDGIWGEKTKTALEAAQSKKCPASTTASTSPPAS